MTKAAQTLLKRIHQEGKIAGDIIKVDLFLNHMVDPQLIELLGAQIASDYSGSSVEKILTAETSGIMLAQAVAGKLGIPFVYAKKKRPRTMGNFFAAASFSFTKQESTTLYVAKEVLKPQERVLFVDDFFAQGSTQKAISEIIQQAGATLIGTAVIINKSTRSDIHAILTLEQIRNMVIQFAPAGVGNSISRDA